jgi:hypothetical protein
MIKYILYNKSNWLDVEASSVMARCHLAVEASSPVNSALDIFAKTGYGFTSVTVNHYAVTSLSLRDMLKIVSVQKLETPIREFASPLIMVDKKNISIGNAIQMMLDQRIRNLVVNVRYGNDNSSLHILNDRKILEFLFSHKGGQLMQLKGIEGLFRIGVETLDMLKAQVVTGDMPISAAARLFGTSVPCLLLNGSILTPWDIVMKLRKMSCKQRNSS